MSKPSKKIGYIVLYLFLQIILIALGWHLIKYSVEMEKAVFFLQVLYAVAVTQLFKLSAKKIAPLISNPDPS